MSKKTNILIIVIAYTIFTIFLLLTGKTLANEGDYSVQFSNYIMYIVENFRTTLEFFPQLNMNLGLSQSFAYMYYYGMYNPYIIILQILFFIPTSMTIYCLNLMLIIFTYDAYSRLFKLFLIDKRNLVNEIALIATFGSPVILNLTNNLIMIYYFPIFIYSLVSLKTINKREKYWEISIYTCLIFYTNFFFAPVISLLQFFWYLYWNIGCEEKVVTIKNISTSTYKYLKYYILGILASCLIMVPQIYLLLTGARSESNFLFDYSFLYSIKEFIKVDSLYNFGLGLWFFVLLILIFKKFKTNYKYLLLVLIFIVSISISFINLFLNVFQYQYDKFAIYFIPIFWVMLVKLIDKEKTENFTYIVLSSLAIFVFLIFFGVLENTYVQLFSVLSVIILFISDNRVKKVITSIIVLILLFTNLTFKNIEEYEIINTTSRDLIIGSEYSKYNINDYSVPNMYTSFVNPYYLNFFNNYILVEDYGIDNYIISSLFDNMYLQNLLGLEEENSNPIIYGVEESDARDINVLNGMNKSERLLYLNQYIFIDEEVEKVVDNNFNIQHVNGTNLNGLNDLKKFIFDSKQYDKSDGLFAFVIDVENNGLVTESESGYRIIIDNHITNISTNSSYTKLKDKYIILIDAEKFKNSEVKFVTFGQEVYRPDLLEVNLYYQSKDDFENNKLKIIEPINIDTVINTGYEVEIDMPNDGYLTTTIPFDKGFKITIDGEEVEPILIDNVFLGSKIDKGSHQVKITYNIPYFKISLFITLVSIICILVLVVKSYKLQ